VVRLATTRRLGQPERLSVIGPFLGVAIAVPDAGEQQEQRRLRSAFVKLRDGTPGNALQDQRSAAPPHKSRIALDIAAIAHFGPADEVTDVSRKCAGGMGTVIRPIGIETPSE
jgi:hypothetical protein